MSKKLPSILFILDYYWPHIGGGEVLFTGLAEGLAKRGWKVTVVTQHVKGSPSHEVHHGVEIHRHWSSSRYLFSWACVPLVWRLSSAADIIHAETFAAAPPAWLVSRLRRKPLVLTVHEIWAGKWNQVSDDSAWSNWLNDKIERLLYCLDYGHYVAVSQATARDLMAYGIPPSSVHTIYNGLEYGFWNPEGLDRRELRHRYGMAEDSYVFMYSGRPGCSKGLPYLIRAMGKIAEDHPQAMLWARVSRGKAVRKDYEQVLALIDDLGLQKRIRLISPVEYQDIPSMTYCADAVVVPSLCEGFGFAAAEACAMGRPVIVSRAGALPEVVSGQVLLIPPRDVDSLAEALVSAMNGAFETIPEKKFTLQAMIEKYMELYAQLTD